MRITTVRLAGTTSDPTNPNICITLQRNYHISSIVNHSTIYLFNNIMIFNYFSSFIFVWNRNRLSNKCEWHTLIWFYSSSELTCTFINEIRRFGKFDTFKRFGKNRIRGNIELVIFLKFWLFLTRFQDQIKFAKVKWRITICLNN